jgi:plastocyanin
MAGRLVRRIAIGSAACFLGLALAGTALGTYHGGGDPAPPPTEGAGGGEAEVVAEPVNQYENPQVSIDAGDRLFFRNNDVGNPEPHNVTSVAGPGRLFRSDTILARPDPIPVRGVPSLDPGSYGFFCSIHPQQMRGTLTVNGAVLGLQVRPRRTRMRAPGTQRFRATVRNRGNQTASQVRVCAARTPRGINVRGRPCRAVGALEVGATRQVRFRVRATRRASAGRNRIGFAARSPGARNGRAQAILRVRR